MVRHNHEANEDTPVGRLAYKFCFAAPSFIYENVLAKYKSNDFSRLSKSPFNILLF